MSPSRLVVNRLEWGSGGRAVHLVAGQSLRHGAQLWRRVLLVGHGHVQVPGIILLLRWCEEKKKKWGGRRTDKHLLPRAGGEQKETSAIRDRWEEEERRSHLHGSFIQKKEKGAV